MWIGLRAYWETNYTTYTEAFHLIFFLFYFFLTNIVIESTLRQVHKYEYLLAKWVVDVEYLNYYSEGYPKRKRKKGRGKLDMRTGKNNGGG